MCGKNREQKTIISSRNIRKSLAVDYIKKAHRET